MTVSPPRIIHDTNRNLIVMITRLNESIGLKRWNSASGLQNTLENPIDYPAKPNGNTLAVLEPVQRLTLDLRSQPILLIIVELMIFEKTIRFWEVTAKVQREIIAAQPPMSRSFCRTGMDSMICTEIFGNGVKIIGILDIKTLRSMVQLG